MADSIRTQLIAKIDARLKAILVTGGYKTNLGQNVFPWKTTPFGEDEVPGVTYRDLINKKEDPGSIGKFRWNLMVEIEISIPDQTPAGTIRNYIADVLKAVGTDYRWANLAIRTDQPDTEITAEQESQIILGSKNQSSDHLRFTTLGRLKGEKMKVFYDEGYPIHKFGVAGEFRIGEPREIPDDLAEILIKKETPEKMGGRTEIGPRSSWGKGGLRNGTARRNECCLSDRY